MQSRMHEDGEESHRFTWFLERSDTLVIGGEMDKAAEDRARAAFLWLVRQAPGDCLVVEVSGVTFCDAAGLRVFLELHRAALGTHRTVVLRGPGRQLERLLHVTGAAGLFVIQPS